MTYKCYNCGSDLNDGCDCPTPKNSFKFIPICERIGCDKPATKGLYALGYIASVCQEHYDSATQEERDNAVRFRYAEG